jgi:hypothetical protein
MPRSHSHPKKSGEEAARAARAGKDDEVSAEDLRRQVAHLAEQVSQLGEAAAGREAGLRVDAEPAQAAEAPLPPPPRPRARTPSSPAPSSPAPQPAASERPRDAGHATAPIDRPFVEPSPAQRAAAEMARVEQHLIGEGAVAKRAGRLGGRGEEAAPEDAGGAAGAGGVGDAGAAGESGASAPGGVEPETAVSAAAATGAPASEGSLAEQSSRLVESVVTLAELAAIEIRASAEFEAAAIRAQSDERLSAPTATHLLTLLDRQHRMLAALAAQTERLDRAGGVLRAQIRALEAEHEHLYETVASARQTP